MPYAEIGAVSEGTLRNEDLLATFADLLEALELRSIDFAATGNDPYADADARAENAALIAEARRVAPDSEQADEIVNALIDALETYAPPYCYFGTLEGDGACFGFWPSMDAIEELPRIADPNELPTGEDCVFVNDHGNVTVYDGDGKMIFDLV